MYLRNSLLLLLCVSFGFGQELPDRDVLVKKFLDEATAAQAVSDLYKNFGSGGLRSIISNVNALPTPERRLEFMRVFKQMDLDRFLNGVNNNIGTSQDTETKAMWVMYLGTLGRNIDPASLEKYVGNESEDLRVRLAAMSGLCMMQLPERYERFFKLADTAVVDPSTGKNDLLYANLSKNSGGLFYYAKGLLDKPKPSKGVILTVLAMADGTDASAYEAILKLRQKEWVPLMIDRAIQAGAPELIDVLMKNKLTKKEPNLEAAKAAATTIQGYKGKLFENLTHDQSKSPLAANLAMTVAGSGAAGQRAGYAIVKVGTDGKVSVVEKMMPFGAGDPFGGLKQQVLPATIGWEPVESLYLVVAP